MSVLVSDDVNMVLIDHLLARGIVRSIEVWTDEEAELCRLAAFAGAQRLARLPVFERLVRVSVSSRSGVFFWQQNFEGAGTFSVERVFSQFDPPDFALESPRVDRERERAWMERTEVAA